MTYNRIIIVKDWAYDFFTKNPSKIEEDIAFILGNGFMEAISDQDGISIYRFTGTPNPEARTQIFVKLDDHFVHHYIYQPRKG